MNARRTLEQVLNRLDLEFNEEAISLLLSYQALVLKWNKSYNLTATRDPAEFFTRHLLGHSDPAGTVFIILA